MYLIQIKDGECLCKCEIPRKDYTLQDGEIEITKEQYDMISLPCKYIDGEFVPYEIPEPPTIEPEPTAQDDIDAMLVDHEYRLTLLELGVAE